MRSARRPPLCSLARVYAALARAPCASRFAPCRYVLSAQHDRAFIARADVTACIRAMEAAEDVNYIGAVLRG